MSSQNNNKMNSKYYLFLGYFFHISGLITFVVMSFYLFEEQTFEIEMVDCYDEYHNKIIGLQCEEIINQPNGLFYLSALSVAVMIVLGISCITVGRENE